MLKSETTDQRVVMQSPIQALHIVLVIVLVVGAYLLGSLKTKVDVLEKGGYSAAGTNQPSQAGTAAGNANQPAPQVPPPVQTADNVPKVTKDDHVKGDRKARFALIEYSDIECPFCKSFHPTAQKAVEEYSGKLMWVFRHYPLSFHANAQKEAEASECANDIGGNDAFWKMVDTMYERTTSNGTGFALDKIVPLAVEIGLDEQKFKTCFDNAKFVQRIKDDADGGTKAGVTGTPGNILLDTKTGKTRLIPGAVPYEQLKVTIDEMLKA